MRLFVPCALLLIASPASAALFNFEWKGTVDYGDTDVKEVSGSFLYDDSAPIVYSQDQGEVLGGSLNGFSLLLAEDRWYRNTAWDAHRMIGTEEIGFFDANLNGPTLASLHWNLSGWELEKWDEETDSASLIGGKISYLKRTGWIPPLPGGGDAAPVPEPSSMALLASGLIGLAGYRRFRAGRTSAPFRQ